MSYATLPQNVLFTDPNQLPAFLEFVEGNIPWLYDDGQGNPTIGIGMNLTNRDNMAIILSLMTQSSVSQSEVDAFEEIIQNAQKLPSGVSSDGSVQKPPSQQYSQTQALQNALNAELAKYVQPGQVVSFTNFPQSLARKALQDALTDGYVVAGYGAITSYSQKALNWLQGGNPYGITVTTNIPTENSGAWEALVSLFYNQSENSPLLGPKLMTALNIGDLAQAWFEIRYGSNSGWESNTKATQGVAKRRYLESQLFGLSADNYGQAIQAYEVLEANRSTMLRRRK